MNVTESTRTDAVSIIAYAENYVKANKGEFQKDDIIYCIFDRDGNDNEKLDKARKMASKNGFKIIFSNPCFEYWILCHFEYFQQCCDAKELVSRIRERHLTDYRKNDPDIYEKTELYIPPAVINAKRSVQKHVDKKVDPISEDSNPCTTVYTLMETFMKLKKQEERLRK